MTTTRNKLLCGDDYTFIINVLDNGLPRSLEGIQGICYQVYLDATEENLLYESVLDNGINIPDVSDGKIFIKFPSYVSENNKKFQLYHRCRIVDESGRKTTILSDYIEFYKNNLSV